MKRCLDRAHENARNSRGSIMIMALFCVMLMAYLASRVTSQGIALSQISREITAGSLFRNHIRSKLTPLPLGSGRGCAREVISDGDVSQAWYVCSIDSAPLRQEPPGPAPVAPFDWASIFSNAIVCQTGRTPTARRAFTTPSAAFDCAIPADVHGNLIVVENLRGGTVTVAAPSPATAILVATPGELTMQNSLTLSSDAVLVTGGDLSIPLLSNSSGRVIYVTLASAHGAIRVERLSGSISLRGFGRSTISLPQSLAGSQFPLLPTRSATLCGISPAL